MKIINIIDEVSDGKERLRNFNQIRKFAIHRAGRLLDEHGNIVSDLGKTAEEISAAFTSNPDVTKYTGGELAYTLVIEEDGTVKQCLALDDIGQHARRWNVTALGIALIGDFRHEAPTEAQWDVLVELLTMLCQTWALDPDAAIRGHDELPGGRKSLSKACPGKMLSLSKLRDEVAEALRAQGKAALVDAGAIWRATD